MKNDNLIYILLINLFIFFISCNREETDGILYFNSFESLHDISNIGNNNFVRLNTDSPPEGGKYSIEIIGGCFAPSPEIVIDKLDNSSYLTISFYGKGGGYVFLHSDTQNYSLLYSEKDWKYHELTTKTFFSKGEKIKISFYSPTNGASSGFMLVDLLTVKATGL